MSTSSHNSTTNNDLPAKVTACVTGASGFLGAAVAICFLDLGHAVRLPLRKEEQARAWREKYGERYEGRIETVLLEKTMEKEGAFDEAVKGCDVVVHAASPAIFEIKTTPEEEVFKPAINGTLSILRSAHNAGTVKSVVITSSDSAYCSVLGKMHLGPEDTLSDASWNPITYEEAVKMDKTEGEEIYSASKTLAEKAAWDFVKDPSVRFKLCTLGPSCVIGYNPSPLVKTLKDVRSSVAITAGALWDKQEFPPHNLKTFRPECFVPIASVAEAHVLAALHPSRSGGKRFLLVGHRSSLERLVREMIKAQPALKEHLPPLPEKEGEGEGPKGQYKVEANRVEKELGFEYQPWSDCIKEFAEQICVLAKAGGQL
ncbi:hypothetical protein JCM6882_001780 [Rhodosporidiobolus microsporus]